VRMERKERRGLDEWEYFRIIELRKGARKCLQELRLYVWGRLGGISPKKEMQKRVLFPRVGERKRAKGWN